ncbi:Uncharacterized protein AC511_4827 [Pseudomonas coronafaciens pv. oryzae]|nr:Uncharacterized protein AC511_4827 [Pseudomonas coronafaciens pv. oryzae]
MNRCLPVAGFSGVLKIGKTFFDTPENNRLQSLLPAFWLS